MEPLRFTLLYHEAHELLDNVACVVWTLRPTAVETLILTVGAASAARYALAEIHRREGIISSAEEIHSSIRRYGQRMGSTGRTDPWHQDPGKDSRGSPLQDGRGGRTHPGRPGGKRGHQSCRKAAAGSFRWMKVKLYNLL